MQALQSIRVLDLTRLLPGPFCTMVLADFGAEVIKIEDPNLGDYARYYEPKIDEDSVIFHSLNRNKKSICLDLKSIEGKAAFLKLVKEADIVVESFRPGVMKRLGLDYETLKKVNPRLIYCAITGYGQTGPLRDKAGHDLNFISYAGLLDLMGEKGSRPIIPSAHIGDIGGGSYPALVGILLALFARTSTGRGQFIDISMLDNTLSWMQTTLPIVLMANKTINRAEHMLFGGLACYEVYQTKDLQWLSVAALEPRFWINFCQGINRVDLIEYQRAKAEKQDWLKAQIQETLSQKTLNQWVEIFEKLEACVSPVLSLEEAAELPHVQTRGIIESLSNHGRTLSQIGIPIKLSDTPGQITSSAPKLGEHTNEILKDIENR